jgi:uncharacterized membrane protein
MKMPVTIEQFLKNPIGVIAFLALMVIAYLYVDLKNLNEKRLQEIESSCVQRIDDHKERIESLEGTVKVYEDRLTTLNEKLLECLGED